MTKTALFALLSHWRSQPLQFAALLLGLAAATALWTGVQAINSEARKSYDRAAQALGQGTEVRLVSVDGGGIHRETFAVLRRAGWQVSPVVEGTFQTGAFQVQVRGVDPFTLPPSAASPDLLDQGRLARFLDGELILTHADVVPGLTALGLSAEIVPNVPAGQAMMDITAAWDVLETSNFSYLILTETRTNGLPALADLVPQLERITHEPEGDIAQLTQSFHLNLTAFGLLSFAVGLFIVHASIGLAFEQRRGMFRTLRALGLSAGRLTALLAVETLLLATLAGALGIGLGYLIATALLPGVAATLDGLYGASVAGSLTLDPTWVASGFVITFAGAAAASAQSLYRVATLPILAPAKPRAWAMASSKARPRQAVFGALLMLVSLGIAAFGSGLVAGFLMLGALLFGAALLLPSALNATLRLLSPFVRGPVFEWALADTRQQLPGLSLALMALMLALATNIGVGTMVSSFRLTFTGWLDQRLASEVYVTAENSAQAQDVHRFLDDQADATLPIRATSTPLMDQPGQIFGVVDHQTYRDGWPLLTSSNSPWEAVAQGSGVLINEQLWRRTDLILGADLELLPGWVLPVVGVYSDYGNPKAQAIVAQSDLLGRVQGGISTLGYAARTGRPSELRDGLITLGVPAGNIRNQAQVKAFSLNVFDRTFLVTGALNLLTLGVAAFAILAALTTLATMRLPQLAPVWAMGITRAQLARIELLRSALFAALTFVFALPLGLALAYALLAVVNVQAFGWRLPMHTFPLDWLRLLILAILAALIAASFPALRLARLAPSRLLKVFADER